MAVYNEKERKENATIGKDRYPIGDKTHARLALRFINRGGLSDAQKAKVRARANKMLYGDNVIKRAQEKS